VQPDAQPFFKVKVIDQWFLQGLCKMVGVLVMEVLLSEHHGAVPMA
jgi:hypothetical protein